VLSKRDGETERKRTNEGGGRAGSDVHVGEETDESGGDEAVDGETVLRAATEDGGRLAVAGETVEGTRRGVKVRVSGREGGDKDDGVDDRRETLDARVLDGDDLEEGGALAGEGETRQKR
jgi:hypothetical protein